MKLDDKLDLPLYKILIIDDDPFQVELLKDLLVDEYHLLSVNQPDQAVEMIQSGKPDLIILDLMMPGVDGFELCRRISSHERMGEIPVVMVTALTDEEDLKKGLESGASDYIRKPVFPVEFKARIRNAIRLRESVNRLRESNLIKDEFVSMVSHDLKIPLTSMMGNCEILLDERMSANLSDKQKVLIREIFKSARYQFAIINDLLNLSMMESGKINIQKRKFNIRELFNRVTGQLKANLESKEIRIEADLSGIDYIVSDEDRMYQVMSNILINAVKFSYPKGLIKIQVTHMDNNFIRISVADQGIGIEPENLVRVLNPYQIVTHPGTAGEKGTGMGIKICLRIVEALGGQLGAVSIPGKGSEFYLILPEA